MRSFVNTKAVPSREHLRLYSSESQGSRPAPSEHRTRSTQSRAKRKMKFLSVGLGIDMPFLIIVLVLLAIGILMMFSASYPYAYANRDNDSYYYLTRQIKFAVFGIALMIGCSFVNYHYFYRFSKIILGISYLLLGIVLCLPAVDGVKRWIFIGSTGFQASEVSKFAVIVFMAYIATKNAEKMQYIKYSFIPGVAVFGSTALLLFFEPHYSCIVIMFLLILVMLWLGGMPLKYFVVILSAVAVLFIIGLTTGLLGYAMERMDGWGTALEYHNEDQWQATWQTRNSLYAIGSGGVFGQGLGNSRQKYLYIPEPQNDFVFAVVCEELGLIGAIAILILFALLVWRGIYISQRCSDVFGKLLGCGLSAQIGLQVILNILVITDWLPNTGISLPFFSYGGTSLIMLLAQMGVVLSISRRSRVEKV